MNREIKFRAWDGQEMLLFALFEKPWPYNSENPVMQFTGLRDKNGKEIYEGDIIEFEEPVMESAVIKCPVVFWEGMFVAEWDIGSSVNRFPLQQIVEHEVEWEIIGNIYENPELISL